ncbi:response regulator [Paenibacillus sp. IB182496]|uniref:Response regulator n=1 Tax=Paenibacillus sabuli TaxID=2772509 RepID=A0A927BTU7_9BACL|nr:response regulator [Paenibacillus sabuli]MBD2845419.1 response regulator [Paenibacillus sabuli]
MKALIVDDERHVREAIRMLIDWDSYGIAAVLEAADGEAATRLIEMERPAIVFTDMLMPLMHGMELLTWIRRHHPACKTIVVSGHDDFDYVRHTMQSGGSDYLLKPIDEEQLNEVLRKAVDEWHAEEQSRDRDRSRTMKLNAIQPIYWDKAFTQLTEEPDAYAALARELEAEFGLAQDTRLARVAVLTLETMQRTIKERFASNLDLLAYAIANIANEILSRKGRVGYAFRNASKAHEMVIVCWADAETLPARVREINAGIDRTYGVAFDFGIGGVRRFPGELPQTHREALYALKRRNLLEGGERVHLYAEGEGLAGSAALRFERHRETLRLAVLGGGASRIAEAAGAWFDEVRALQAVTIEQLDLWVHEFAVLRARCLEGRTPGPALAQRMRAMDPGAYLIPVDASGRLSIAQWQREVEGVLQAMAEELRAAAPSPTMKEIADYLETHYREELSLQVIAGRFGFSREYVSRRFKQELGENVSDYLLRVRMEKAKLLLLSPQWRVAQVAEMVGFADEKYFSKVFKKWTGRSPKQFQRIH